MCTLLLECVFTWGVSSVYLSNLTLVECNHHLFMTVQGTKLDISLHSFHAHPQHTYNVLHTCMHTHIIMNMHTLTWFLHVHFKVRAHHVFQHIPHYVSHMYIKLMNRWYDIIRRGGGKGIGEKLFALIFCFYQLALWTGDMTDLTVKQKCNFQDNCFGKLGKVRIADSFEFIYREKEGKDKKYMHECNHGYLHQCTLKLGNL